MSTRIGAPMPMPIDQFLNSWMGAQTMGLIVVFAVNVLQKQDEFGGGSL